MASPPNTPSLYYLDSKTRAGVCKTDADEVEKKCAPDENNKANRGLGKPKSRLEQLKKQRENDTAKNKNKDEESDAAWVLDHCGPLLMKPGEDFDIWKEKLGSVDKAMKEVATKLQDEVIGKVQREAMEYGLKAIGKMAVRRGLTGWIPVVGWIMTAIDVGTTAIEVAQKIKEMQGAVDELKKTVENLKKQAKVITDTYDKYKNQLKNYNKLSQEAKDKLAREVMVDVQTAYGASSPCLRARKCMLVPYNKGRAAKWAGKGCCPGQTGHHILPDAMFRDEAKKAAAKADWKADAKNTVNGKLRSMPRDKLPTAKCWDEYSEGKSPTICLEGANQHTGSHGVLHGVTDGALGVVLAKGKKDLPYSEARDLALDEISTMYGCKIDCLKAQLDAYYCKVVSKGPGCKNCADQKVEPNSGKGGTRDGDSEFDSEEEEEK